MCSLQIIGKHGLLATFGFAEPVRQALVNIESVVDVSLGFVISVAAATDYCHYSQSFALSLVNLIPTQEPMAMQQRASLDASLNVAITTYS
jgi:hypothetical protein